MQWFAYVIWSALILCVLSAVVCYVMARRRAHLPQAPAPGCSGGHLQETPSTELDSARCQQLVERCGFDSAMLDAMTPDQQMTLGVDVLGADPAWLQGKDSAMYPCLTFHNQVAAAVEFIDTRLQEHPELRLYAVKPEGVPLDESVYEASVVLCFAQPVQVNDQEGWRYFPVNVYWEWGYPPEQMQCRQVLYLACCAGCKVVGIESDMDDIYELLEGIALPPCIDDKAAGVWPAADYALPGQDVMGLTDCHLRSAQLMELVTSKGWSTVEPGTK
nr:hypothetical protein [uncultured Desulfuromonas sp.]